MFSFLGRYFTESLRIQFINNEAGIVLMKYTSKYIWYIFLVQKDIYSLIHKELIKMTGLVRSAPLLKIEVLMGVFVVIVFGCCGSGSVGHQTKHLTHAKQMVYH
jgi:hypothetical protein